MAAQDVYIFVDPDAHGVTVEELRKATEDCHGKERVVVATGDVNAPFVPVRSIVGKEKLVMEL